MIEMITPPRPNSSPEWRWWNQPFSDAKPVPTSGGRQRHPSGQVNRAGGAAAAASSAVVGSAAGHRSAAWLSRPVAAIQNRKMPKNTDSQRCYLRKFTSLNAIASY